MPKARQTCTRCSMRRQRCDRQSPCQRCVDSGLRESCTRVWSGGYNAGAFKKRGSFLQWTDQYHAAVHRRYPRARPLPSHDNALEALESSLPGSLDCNSLPILISTLQSLLPHPRTILQLVDYHSKSLQLYHGSVSGRSFRRELIAAQWTADSLAIEQLDLKWCAVLFATLAASLACAPDEVSHGWGFHDQHKSNVASVWYRAAIVCLRMGQALARPCVRAVQTIQILFMSAVVLGFQEQQFDLFGVASHIVQSLGFRPTVYTNTMDVLLKSGLVDAESSLESSAEWQRVYLQLCVQDWLATRALTASIVEDTAEVITFSQSEPNMTWLGSGYRNNTIAPSAADAIVSIDSEECLTRLARSLAKDRPQASIPQDGPSRFRQIIDLDFKLRAKSEDNVNLADVDGQLLQAYLIILTHRPLFEESFVNSSFTYSQWASATAAKQIVRSLDAVDHQAGPLRWNLLSLVVVALHTLCQMLSHTSNSTFEYAEYQQLIGSAMSRIRSTCYAKLAATLSASCKPRQSHNAAFF